MESTYENGLFASLKSSIDTQIDSDDTPDSVAVKAMAACHQLMVPRAKTFKGDLGLAATLFHSTAVDLMTTRGACGAYSQVLARTLETFHYPVRIAQMKANGIYGAHNIVEAQIGTRWVVLDPTYNLYFVRPDARLASFADVKNDWSFYSRQLPADYNPAYHYEDVRYTNWGKIPVVSPAMKGLVSIFIGRERADTFSMRTAFFMNTYAVYSYILIALYIPLFLLTLRGLLKTKVFPSPEIPVTFRNIIKYLRPRPQGTSYSNS